MANDLLLMIIQSIIAIIIALFGKYIFPIIKEKRLDTYVKRAVRAAEILYTDNKTRKEYAISAVSAAAKKIGLKLTDDEIDTIIEAAVEDLNIVIKSNNN